MPLYHLLCSSSCRTEQLQKFSSCRTRGFFEVSDFEVMESSESKDLCLLPRKMKEITFQYDAKTAPKRRMIQICTDSQAVLMAIESSKVKSRLVLDCKKYSKDDLASCNRVILTWVPRHSGVPGNEEADSQSRINIRINISGPIGPEPILGVPLFNGGFNHERAPT
ncbi:hypothetical protein NQ318_003140 [Aromia moschata]|uniref:RNase H type-1 domain-containing protein n=1 Tax=Aromia moschata TaxID=1265417 RepID=A0AAV8YS78_9CUCU|nr:hypothetical protein NQ318_003140 [Aromia moschata]